MLVMTRQLSKHVHDILSLANNAPRGGFNPSTLPSTRDISTALHNSIMPEATTLSSKGLTLMTMQFAQFLDHDTTLTPEQGKYSFMKFYENFLLIYRA